MEKKKTNLQLLLLLCLNCFTFALISNIPGALLPYWKDSFHLSSMLLTFLGSAFFLAYGLTSLPQGVLLDRIGNKKTFLWGISLVFLGSTIFALVPRYEVGLISLFVIGTGVTVQQMVGNLLVKKIDDDETKYSRNLTLIQIFCGIGGLGGGFLISFLIKDMGLQWQSIYYLFTALAFLVAALIFSTNIPENTSTNDEKPTIKDYIALAKNPLMTIFALGIFIYVGIEVGIATWISTFLVDKHGSLKSTAAQIVGLYWGFQAIGRFTGGIILNYLNTSKALILYSLGCLISLIFAVISPSAYICAISFISVGFFTSIMFPSIFSLTINSFDKKEEGTVAGVLCTTVAGGAIVAPIIGFLANVTSLGTSLIIVSTIAFGYIAFLGFKTLPKTMALETLGKNKTTEVESSSQLSNIN